MKIILSESDEEKEAEYFAYSPNLISYDLCFPIRNVAVYAKNEIVDDCVKAGAMDAFVLCVQLAMGL